VLSLMTLFGIYIADYVFARLAIAVCSSNMRSLSTPGYKALVVSDVHVNAVCPFSDLWMWNIRSAASSSWQAREVVCLGDMFSTVGGDSGSFNVSDLSYRLQASRVRAILGCSAEGGDCSFMPGNHDIAEFGPAQARYLDEFGEPSGYGSLRGGALRFFKLGFSLYELPQRGPVEADGPVDVLLLHEPAAATAARSATAPASKQQASDVPDPNFMKDLVQIIKPTLILSGDKHEERYHTHTAFSPAPGGIPEAVLPSLNYVRSFDGDGNMGIAVLSVLHEGAQPPTGLRTYENHWERTKPKIAIEVCRPLNRGFFLILHILAILMMAALAKKLGVMVFFLTSGLGLVLVCAFALHIAQFWIFPLISLAILGGILAFSSKNPLRTDKTIDFADL